MQEVTGDVHHENSGGPKWKLYLKNTGYILLALLIFLFALDLMISSLQQLGKTAAETILLATSNPFTALFIGLLITAIIQSSSATTSMVVALVASGSLTFNSAIPIIMGANIGTTITSTIVSLGFIARKKEFTRAVSAGTYHDFFNILTVVILFPFEYYYGFLSGLAHQIATTFFHEPVQPLHTDFSLLGHGFTPVIHFLVTSIPSGFILSLLSFGLLFGSILFFRKVLSDLLGIGSQDSFQKFFFQNRLKSFGWGLITTATIRSSTITTSLVVPLVAKKVIKLENAVPFILGANIGTTITAFIAAAFNSNSAISIAIAHFLFNFFGVLLFLFVPYVKEIPLKLAIGLGQLTRKYRLAGFLYLLVIFFFIPFSLIYLHKEDASLKELTYKKVNTITHKTSHYTIIIRNFKNQRENRWMIYGDGDDRDGDPTEIITVFRRKNVLFLNNDLYEFNKQGFCRDTEDTNGKHSLCIERILPSYTAGNSFNFDSVYVFRKFPVTFERKDSTSVYIYISPTENIIVKKERKDLDGNTLEWEMLTEVEIK